MKPIDSPDVQLSPMEIVIVAAVALIVLGPDRLPKAARQVGKAIAELKRLSAGVKTQVDDAIRDDEGDPKAGSKARSKAEAEADVEVKVEVEGESSVLADPKSLPTHPDTEGFRLIDGRQPDIQSKKSEESTTADPDAPVRKDGPFTPTVDGSN